MKVLLVFNKSAARVRGNRLDRLSATFAAAGHDVSRIDSYDPEMPTLAARTDLLCIIGGDGTARDVVRKLDGIAVNAKIAIYPLGTINLIAREAGYVADCADFVARSTADTAPCFYHHATMNDGAVMVCASVGPDSLAVAGVSSRLKQHFGRVAYAISAMRLLWHWPRNRMDVTVDGASYSGEAVYLLKGRYYAGPWSLDSAADLRRPMLRILLLPSARRRDYLRLMASLMIHPRFADKSWQRLTGFDVQVHSSKPLPVQADGDITATLPIKVAISPRAMAFG